MTVLVVKIRYAHTIFASTWLIVDFLCFRYKISDTTPQAVTRFIEKKSGDQTPQQGSADDQETVDDSRTRLDDTKQHVTTLETKSRENTD